MKKANGNSDIITSVTLHKYPYYDDLYRKYNGAGIDIAKRRKRLVEILDTIIEQYNTKLLFLPNVGLDMDGFLEVRKLMKNKDKTTIINHDGDFTRYATFLSNSEILIGMRLHSLILATRLGVPFVPISYSSKVDSYLHLLKLDDLRVDIEEIESPDFDELVISIFSKVFNNRGKYSKLLLYKSKTLHKRSFKTAKLLAELVNH